MSIVAQTRQTLFDLCNRLAESALPASCLLCHGGTGGSILCPACAADLPQLPSARCPVCAAPTPASAVCGHCLQKPPHFDSTYAVWRYDFPLDKLIQAYKYGHQLALSRFFAEALKTVLSPAALTTSATLHPHWDRIIPLPLAEPRLRQRGYNQSQELARPLARHLGVRLDTAICSRPRHTLPQAELPLAGRAKNIRNAFACRGSLAGEALLLIDDVMTTGASLNECARTLKLHGAARVDVAVLARTCHH